MLINCEPTMSSRNNAAVRTTLSAEMFDHISESLKKRPTERKTCYSRPLSPDPKRGTSFEVFRNHSTAVEVMVKEINRKKRTVSPNSRSKSPTRQEQRHKIQTLQKELENLKIDLNIANNKLAVSRNGFKKIINELTKQLNAVSNREVEQHSQNIVLQLENEKLKTLLESKSKFLKKLKKETVSITRLLRILMKGLRNIPMIPGGTSDISYDDFEQGLKDAYPTFASNTREGLFGDTFNSTKSKHEKRKGK